MNFPKTKTGTKFYYSIVSSGPRIIVDARIDEYDFRMEECATLAAGVQVTRVTCDPRRRYPKQGAALEVSERVHGKGPKRRWGEEWTQKYLDNRAQSYDNNDQLSICHSKDTPAECTTNRTLFLRRPPILLLLFLLPEPPPSIPSPLPSYPDHHRVALFW